jgi:hypothetical protein
MRLSFEAPVEQVTSPVFRFRFGRVCRFGQGCRFGRWGRFGKCGRFGLLFGYFAFSVI